MNQAERRIFLIRELLKEQPRYRHMEIPRDQTGQRQLLRSLMNIRMPGAAAREFLEVQDAYLREETAGKGIVDLEDMESVAEGIYLWQGDITRLRCDAIVNAANSGMTGCYAPCHGCIDNCIHTFSGIQLRLACAELMEKQGHEEETGKAKITPAFNLPCRYVIHTVGPIISGPLREKDKGLLASCYRSCLELAEENHLESIAFCCISTGEFHFPNDIAAQIAVRTVREFMQKGPGIKKAVFNVFKDLDKKIYENLFQSLT
ncbi:MAG: protein-ADP-ribose hydrolase [Lachnospiraceae bacterium]|nr:protein-ADP-ribose hydrolase [Butyrivibrio sp.]MCM1344436.1 protein-ADP-ribose hydrolase [Muribaculaceae bacterium]MCM1411826.1 protein-ADP-ribose hydrolase [Lachnospiraceae bacterium]